MLEMDYWENLAGLVYKRNLSSKNITFPKDQEPLNIFIAFDFVISLLGIKSEKLSLFLKNVCTFINMIKHGVNLFDALFCLYDGLLYTHIHHYKREFLLF